MANLLETDHDQTMRRLSTEGTAWRDAEIAQLKADKAMLVAMVKEAATLLGNEGNEGAEKDFLQRLEKAQK